MTAWIMSCAKCEIKRERPRETFKTSIEAVAAGLSYDTLAIKGQKESKST